MNEQIGKIFTVGMADYKVVSAKPFDPEHKNMIRIAEEMQGKLCGKNKDKWELRR